jgi:hypothetical protein
MTALSEAVSARENATAEMIKADMCKACPGDIFYGGRPKRAASGRLVCEFSPVAFGYLAPTLFAAPVSEKQQSNPYIDLDKSEYASLRCILRGDAPCRIRCCGPLWFARTHSLTV